MTGTSIGPVSRQLTLLATLFAIMAHGVETTAALDLLTGLFSRVDAADAVAASRLRSMG